MCQLNLELRSLKDRRVPVFSIVELVAYGMGSTGLPDWLKRHLIDPRPLFQRKGFSL
jgi:heterodisulfide reductase subunit B